MEAAFESQDGFPNCIVESMRAVDGTTLTLSLRDFGSPKAYVREVKEGLTEVGAFAVPAEFTLEINGVVPVGQPEVGPLAEAPPVGADVQNLWYESTRYWRGNRLCPLHSARKGNRTTMSMN